MSEFRRRLMMQGGGADTYDSEVEYIRITDGSQAWVDIDVIPNMTTDAIEVDFQQVVNNVQSRIAVGGGSLSNTSTPTTDGRLNMYINGSKNFAVALYNGSSWNYKQIYSENVGTVRRKWKVDYSIKTSSVDEYKNGTWTDTISPAQDPMTVRCGYYNLGGNNGKFNGKIFSIKYWRNGDLIRDMIPVRVGNVGYMFDKIDERLFGSGGSVSLGVGRDRYTDINDYTLPDYVEHYHFRSVIDTRFVPNNNTRAVYTVWQALGVAWQELAGARIGLANRDFQIDMICDSNKLRTVFGNVRNDVDVNVFQFLELDKNKNVLTIKRKSDDTVISTTTQTNNTFNSGRYLWYGGKNKGNLTAYVGTISIATFGVDIYDNDVLIFHFIPAVHPDGTCGLFDNVGKRFYASEQNPFKAGYFYTYNYSNDKCIFYHSNINDDLSIDNTTSDNLFTSLIPVYSSTIRVKRDSNYTTTIVELSGSTIIKKGGQTIISSDDAGDVIELDSTCNNIAVLLSDNPSDGYVPDFKITEIQ